MTHQCGSFLSSSSCARSHSITYEFRGSSMSGSNSTYRGGLRLAPRMLNGRPSSDSTTTWPLVAPLARLKIAGDALTGSATSARMSTDRTSG